MFDAGQAVSSRPSSAAVTGRAANPGLVRPVGALAVADIPVVPITSERPLSTSSRLPSSTVRSRLLVAQCFSKEAYGGPATAPAEPPEVEIPQAPALEIELEAPPASRPEMLKERLCRPSSACALRTVESRSQALVSNAAKQQRDGHTDLAPVFRAKLNEKPCVPHRSPSVGSIGLSRRNSRTRGSPKRRGSMFGATPLCGTSCGAAGMPSRPRSAVVSGFQGRH